MARILIEATLSNGNGIAAEQTFADDARFLNVLQRAFEPDEALPPKQRLAVALERMVAWVRAEAQGRHLQALQAEAVATVKQETDF